MKKISKLRKVISLITLFAVLLISSTNAYAYTREMNAYEKLETTMANDDGWTSGHFVLYWITGIKYFKAGTIVISIDSKNYEENGEYDVQLLTPLNQVIATLPVPMNGIGTVNFTDQPAGNYKIKLIKRQATASEQYYTILRATSI